MSNQIKLNRLQNLRNLVSEGGFTEQEAKTYTITDTDGRRVSLSDPDALEVIDRRIAAEQAKA